MKTPMGIHCCGTYYVSICQFLGKGETFTKNSSSMRSVCKGNRNLQVQTLSANFQSLNSFLSFHPSLTSWRSPKKLTYPNFHKQNSGKHLNWQVNSWIQQCQSLGS